MGLVAFSAAVAYLGTLAYRAFVLWLGRQEAEWTAHFLTIMKLRDEVAALSAKADGVADLSARVGRLEVSRGVGSARG